MRIQNDPPRISTPGNSAGQLRIIGYHGSHTRNHGVHLVPQLMNQPTRIFTADPASVTGDRGDLAVQRGCQLKRHEREAPGDIFYECLIERPAFLFQKPNPDLDSRPPELSKSPTRNQRIGVLHAGNDFLNTCAYQCL